MRPFLVLALVLGAASSDGAENMSDPSADAGKVVAQSDAAPARTGLARFLDPEDGQLDVSNFLAQPRAFLPVPIVVTEPAVGYGGGLAGLFIRPREEEGEEGWNRPNLSAVGAVGTENGTWGGLAGDASRWFDGRLRTQVGGGAGRFNLDFYGLGPNSLSLDQAVRYSLEFTGAVLQANWQLAPKSPWAVGIRYIYADVDPKLRDDPLFPGLADRARVKISAPTPVLEYDSRDNVFTPTRGIYSEASLLTSREALGATEDFERFDEILMGWHTLTQDLTLGARGNYSWSSAGTPFFMRPFVLLRGVPAVRYQGDQMASVEAELRWQFSGRWSLVGFGGAGATRTTTGAFSGTQSVGAGGVGFRYELARRFGMHAGLDVAHSSGTTAVYLVIGNAWFRP